MKGFVTRMRLGDPMLRLSFAAIIAVLVSVAYCRGEAFRLRNASPFHIGSGQK